MIRIVNWLLTRKCNLDCDYCGIVKNYLYKPEEYPDMKEYHNNEMDTITVINALSKFSQHNPDCFHILYGGEPLLRKDLAEILEFCHRHAIHYTVISNNTKEIQPKISDLIKKVGTIKGFTASVDPVFINKTTTFADRYKKSREGFESLLKMKDHCDDVVAEITVMHDDVPYIHKAIKILSEHGISSDLTFVDIAKNEHYDFSNIHSDGELVYPSEQLAHQMMKILTDSSIDVHMKTVLIPAIYAILPSNMDCEIEKDLHNVSIDADGSVRLCLRIRGTLTPDNVHVNDLIDSNGNINRVAHRLIQKDKKDYCLLCNHTCQLMSKHLNENNLDPYELAHLDRRK